jgi:hypothetical protein
MNDQEIIPDSNPLDKPFPIWFPIILPLFALLLLLTARDWRWLEAWPK